MPEPNRMRAAWQLLLRLYPREFRRLHGQELEEIYHWCLDVERRRGRSALGSVRAMADAVRGAVLLRQQTRTHHRSMPMRSIASDVRAAVRGFGRTPWFTAGLVLVLALGVGVNTTIFGLGKAVLLQPLPYADPDRVVAFTEVRPGYPEFRDMRASPELLQTLRAEAGAVVDVTSMMLWATNKADMDLVLPGRAERLPGAFVTPDFFSLLGVDAARGRVFGSADADDGAGLIVVSHRMWTDQLNRDPQVVGRTLTFLANDQPRPFTVIGVLPPAVRVTYPEGIDVWALQDWSLVAPGTAPLELLGRLRPGVTLGQANARLAVLSPTLRPSRDAARQSTIVLEPIGEADRAAARPAVLLLAAVSALLLLIACATVASALLVRLGARGRELAVRASLGASRRRLVFQLLMEGATLAVVGTAVGTLLAGLALPVLRALIPMSIPRGNEIGLDVSWLLFAAAVAAAITILAAVSPALVASRVRIAAALRASGPSASPARSVLRWRAGLVALQTAVATLLLVGATLLLTSFWRLGQVELGFDTGQVFTVEMRLLGAEQRARLPQFQQQVLERVRSIPGVMSVGLSSAVPFRGVDFTGAFDAPGCEHQPWETPPAGCEGPSVSANFRMVDPGYFDVMGIAPLRGRLIDSGDTSSSEQVVVVSEQFARGLFGEADPIGQVLTTYDPRRIVGVVPDLRYRSYLEEAQAAIYIPAAQRPSDLVCLVIRADAGTNDLAAAVQRAVHDTDPTVPVMKFAALETVLGDSVADRRFYTATTSVLASLALSLAAIGLVVVISRSVVERRREMALRSALGAPRTHLVGLIGRKGLTPALLGAALGLAGAWIGRGLVAGFLFEVSPDDPRAFLVAGAIVLATATAASLLPARAVTAAPPAEVLRAD